VQIPAPSGLHVGGNINVRKGGGCDLNPAVLLMEKTMNRSMLETHLAKVEWYVEVSERLIERRRRELTKSNTLQARQLLALCKEMRRWHVAHRDWLRRQLRETGRAEYPVSERECHPRIY
jgi:hypothetical protein